MLAINPVDVSTVSAAETRRRTLSTLSKRFRPVVVTSTATPTTTTNSITSSILETAANVEHGCTNNNPSVQTNTSSEQSQSVAAAASTAAQEPHHQQHWPLMPATCVGNESSMSPELTINSSLLQQQHYQHQQPASAAPFHKVPALTAPTPTRPAAISAPVVDVKDAALSLLMLPEPSFGNHPSPSSTCHSASSLISPATAAAIDYNSDEVREFYGVHPKVPNSLYKLAVLKKWESGRLDRWWVWHDKQLDMIVQEVRNRSQRRLFLNKLRTQHPWLNSGEDKNSSSPSAVCLTNSAMATTPKSLESSSSSSTSSSSSSKKHSFYLSEEEEHRRRWKRKQMLEKLMDEDSSWIDVGNDYLVPEDSLPEVAHHVHNNRDSIVANGAETVVRTSSPLSNMNTSIPSIVSSSLLPPSPPDSPRDISREGEHRMSPTSPKQNKQPKIKSLKINTQLTMMHPSQPPASPIKTPLSATSNHHHHRRPSIPNLPSRLRPVRRLSMAAASLTDRRASINSSLGFSCGGGGVSALTRNQFLQNDDRLRFSIALLKLNQTGEEHRARLVEGNVGEFEKINYSYWDRWSAREVLTGERDQIRTTILDLMFDIDKELLEFDNTAHLQAIMMSLDPSLKKKKNLRKRLQKKLKFVKI